uniref:Piercer of microtubule wall 2 n=1 Tax=Homo sapiens TaxID=9606 RepID=A0A9L9PYH9_HUMAN
MTDRNRVYVILRVVFNVKRRDHQTGFVIRKVLHLQIQTQK